MKRWKFMPGCSRGDSSIQTFKPYVKKEQYACYPALHSCKDTWGVLVVCTSSLLYICFVDLEKAYNCVPRGTLRTMLLPGLLLWAIQSLCNHNDSCFAMVVPCHRYCFWFSWTESQGAAGGGGDVFLFTSTYHDLQEALRWSGWETNTPKFEAMVLW